MKTTALLPFVVLVGVITLSSAQAPPQRPLSPPAETSATIGGKTVTVEYSAPSMRGRRIFGGLVPYGRVWRAGANAATTLYTSIDLDLGGFMIPKGAYSLYIWPEADEWILIVNRQTGQQGDEYHEKLDLARVQMKMSKSPTPIETFRITVSESGAKSGRLEFAWENTIAWVPLFVSQAIEGR